MDEDAVAVRTKPGLPLVLTCEHASERMPVPWAFPEEDRWLVGTHWAYDLGAEELTLELHEALGGTAVASRFTRLLIDPNRPLGDPTLFRGSAEGRAIALNRDLSEAERLRRIDRLWRPYHAAVDRAVVSSDAPLLFAVHSFTPVYEGEMRTLEVGVLFDREEGLAGALAEALAGDGIAVALNEPYSGKAGLIYSADRHAQTHGRHALELEVRQDLAVTDVFRARLARVLSRFIPDAIRKLRG